ncbi:putative calmodulin-binding transcription activator 1 [Apostichopus japonicus]|uniref:Putative calmodulin-binding transcription activator 1 n=1 Tax=Stichopus japonicus TaxID=307972 RepID=A0A2G8JWQ0_STIJA|nr:putative calmodulin-binding transcription activator 1 [Apostichopus japonicus]
MSDRLHRLPIGMSRARGHISLADCLEKMDHQNSNQSAQNSQISQPIEIPTSLSQLPSFMISSPANKTPDSSSRNDFSPAGNENIPPHRCLVTAVSATPSSDSIHFISLDQLTPTDHLRAGKVKRMASLGARESAWEELDRKRAENIALSLEKLKKMFAQDSGDDIMEEAQKPASKYLTLAEQILDALPARIKEDETSMNVDDINFGPAPFFAPLSVDIDEEIESGLIDGTTLGGFSLLTLSDEEQRQLYKAALVIQNAFRQYKGRQQQKQQELEAAVIIQSYYRRYKDYVGYLQMSQAARVIQNRFRSYKNYRQFQKSRKAAIIIQSRFRSYRANKQFRKSRNAAILIQQRFRDKRMARLKREQDAARKIQRFIRHYQNRSVNNMSNLTSAIEQVSQQYE